MITAGGICLSLVAGWAMAGAVGPLLRSLATVALWVAGGAVLMLLLPVVPMLSLLAGVGVGSTARATLFGFAIREGRL